MRLILVNYRANPSDYGESRSIMVFRVVSLIALFVALCVHPLSTLSQPIEHHEQVSIKAYKKLAKLKKKARQKGNIGVLIELNVAPASQSTLRSRFSREARESKIRATRDRVVARLQGKNYRALKGFKHLRYVSLQVDEETLNALASDSEIVGVYEDRLNHPSLLESTDLVGADLVCLSGSCGGGQAVAIIDTGIDLSHPFVGAKVVHQACFSTTSIINNSSSLCPSGQDSQIGGSAGNACSGTIDGCDHGTHVAGIAAGDGVAASVGFSGVASAADLISIQVFSEFTGSICTSSGYSSPCTLAYTSDVIAALDHLYDIRNSHNIAAVNLSLGSGIFYSNCDSEPEKAAIDLLHSAGIAVVVSAGNSGSSSGISAPACISSAVSVGSSTKTDAVSSFSNNSTLLDLFAPGSSINSSIPGGGFTTFSGTSMAAPHVAGTFAIMRAVDPAISVTDALQNLQDSGVSIFDNRNGLLRPRIQIDAALGIFNNQPSVMITSPVDGATISADQTIVFSASAFDDFDGDISDDINWQSNVNGALGSGASIDANLCVGTNTITAAAIDSGDKLGSDAISIDITASAVPPNAVDDSATTDEDAGIDIDVLVNDTVVGNDFIHGVVSTTQGQNGTVVQFEDKVRYIPNPDFNGADSFTYTVNACNGGGDTATVSVTVLPVNDPPIAFGDTAATDEDTSVQIDALANDTDLESHPLSISSVSVPTNGSATHDSQFVYYTPNPDFNGDDSFTYTINDGNGGTSTASINVVVAPASEVYIVPDDFLTITEAINASLDGDTILVKPGTYVERVLITDKMVTLKSTAGPEVTILDRSDIGTTVGLGDGVIFEGFTVRNSVASWSSQTLLGARSSTVSGNIFELTTAKGVGLSFDTIFENNILRNGENCTEVMTIRSRGSQRIQNNLFIDNDCTALRVEVRPEYPYEAVRAPKVINNTFVGNRRAVRIRNHDPVPDARYRNNLIVGNEVGVTTSMITGENLPDWQNNLVFGNDVDYIALPDQTGHAGNISADPLFVNDIDNFRLQAGSPAIDAGDPSLAPSNDYFGATRPIDGNNDAVNRVDIGAIEYLRDGNVSPTSGVDKYFVDSESASIISVLDNDEDLDNDDLVITAVSQAAHGTVTHDGLQVTYSPNSDFSGLDSFTYTVDDGQGGSETFNVYLTVSPSSNIKPELIIEAPGDSTPFIEGNQISFIGRSIDAEDGDISESISWHSSIDGNLGTAERFIANLSIGTHLITAKSIDSVFGMSEAEIVVSVVPDVFVSPWIASTSYDGIVYFLHTDPNIIKRYDMENKRFVHDIVLPGSATAFLVDDSGIFVSVDQNIYQFNHLGTNQKLLTTLPPSGFWPGSPANVERMLAWGDALFLLDGEYRAMSVNKVSGRHIHRGQAQIGASISPQNGKIFSLKNNTTTPTLLSSEVSADGWFGPFLDPLSGNYPRGTNTYVTPAETKVVDNAGSVFDVDTLTSSSSIGGPFDDIVFFQDLTIVNRGADLFAYNGDFGEIGTFEMQDVPASLAAHDQQVFAFHLDENDNLAIEIVPFDSINPTPAGDPVDPTGLAYVPDDIEIDYTNEIVYILSKAHSNIFRWSLPLNDYIESIPLANAPDFMAYSETSNRLYFSYQGGKINQMRLDDSTSEIPFANSPQTVTALATAGEYVFSSDPSNAWNSHYTYGGDGSLLSQVAWTHTSEEFVWSPTNQKMYFISMNVSPVDLHWRDINSDGSLGVAQDSPLHTSLGFEAPTRVAPDGSVVVVGSGRIFEAVSLDYIDDLANPVTDLTWLSNNQILSVRNVNGVSEIQAWDNRDYSLQGAAEFTGAPMRLFAFDDDIVLMTDNGGVPEFSVLSTTDDFDQDGMADFLDTDDDNDGLLDTDEDINGNGLVDFGETDPFNADTDGDGVNDGDEIANGTDPTTSDASDNSVIQIPILSYPVFVLLMIMIGMVGSSRMRTSI